MTTTTMTTTVEPPSPKRPGCKLHGRAFYQSIGSPKRIVAPMVDASELAWRILSRKYNADAAYSPMLHARLFAETESYRRQSLRYAPTSTLTSTSTPTPISSTSPNHNQPALPYDGDHKSDRPFLIQFCANDPQHLLAAAKIAQHHCDAVDLNLGCPQGIARKGHYGAFLQEQPDLIYKLINTLHNELDIPVTAKIRILDTKEATLEYAKMVLDAGASILTVHGRRRDQKSHNTGLADWSYIRYLRDNLPPETVIFANGNILYNADIDACLEITGADGVMCAETNLYNPAVFMPSTASFEERFPRVDIMVRQYLHIIRDLTFGEGNPVVELSREQYRENASLICVKSHLFKLLHAVFTRKEYHYIRNTLGKATGQRFDEILKLADDLEKIVEEQLKLTPETPEQWDDIMKEAGGPGADAKILRIPWWRCQPYVRPTPQQAYENGAMQKSKKELNVASKKGAKESKRELDSESAAPDSKEEAPTKRQKVEEPQPETQLEQIITNDQLASLDSKVSG
ncbi:hypothetical protein TWF102_011783 [Orbilia oligospora]|uniref:tRNA-dihydrouridine(16/17) synthase [NAD(P)(+)] n=1 Tax=Orbilia oligospora TaxID=2813651 RepID=A0A7C8JKH6_ORBOL|nr:hypothetical protein TWF102_011783 [Orbilia oligospora]KAF3091656.1 hypothetical protein TWF103_011645 [Orbilia oligospora]KAF3104631.1 hypothetical protein TWF706_004425 [Orbilia oligospora]KAF3121831.1 hypothetical protein TWF703_001626 [Orbilia oligospora]KAF3129139.1 hypothetical protein TWF594_011145 [Orbilia oligospora]